MKFIYKNLLLAALVATSIVGCKPDLEVPEPKAGSADFSKYVAVGNSLTAGYSDGNLNKSGQAYAYSNILSQQFKAAGGGDFNIPYMLDDYGFGGHRIMGYRAYYCTPNAYSLSPVLEAGTLNPANFSNIYATAGPFQNMGVPGMKLVHFAVPGYGYPGVGNPYFTRMASDPNTTSVQADVMSQNPTFFTFWLGNNDVLGYATSGGSADAITSTTTFDAVLNMAIDSLTKNGAKGAIANIPNVTDIPFFTTIARDAFVLDSTKAAQLNAVLGAMGFTGYTFKVGKNPFLVQDSNITTFPPLRVLYSDELVCLTMPADSLSCGDYGYFIGAGFPLLPALEERHYLSEGEIFDINAAITSYNNSIHTVAVNKQLALVDMNKFFGDIRAKELAGKPYIIDGAVISTTFVSGGAFGLDGVHPTPRGQAMLANEFIKAINARYGATISTVNEVDYRGVILP